MLLPPVEIATQRRRATLERLHLSVLQRPFAPTNIGLLTAATVAAVGWALGDLSWVVPVAAVVGLAAGSWLSRQLTIDVSLAGLRVQGWGGSWIPRPVDLTLPLEDLSIWWTPTSVPFGPARLRTWSVELRHRDGTLTLSQVQCTWDELNQIRTALRDGLTVAAARVGSDQDVPDALRRLQSESER